MIEFRHMNCLCYQVQRFKLICFICFFLSSQKQLSFRKGADPKKAPQSQHPYQKFYIMFVIKRIMLCQLFNRSFWIIFKKTNTFLSVNKIQFAYCIQRSSQVDQFIVDNKYQTQNFTLTYKLTMPPNLKRSLLSFTILILLLVNSHTSDILDFQYTEYTQAATQNYQHGTDLKFQPVRISPDKLQFPQACDLVDQLSHKDPENTDQEPVLDVDSYLSEMKSMFIRLLTLTQKLSNSEDKILHFEGLINQTNPVVPQRSKIQELQKWEEQLFNFTLKIGELEGWLKGNISHIDKSKSNQLGQAKRIEVQFKIQWLTQKIEYLQDIEKKSRFIKQRSASELEYSNYFTDLQKQFKSESKLIELIDRILKKKDILTQLKKERVNLESSIRALKIYTKDIQQCNDEKEKIRNDFKNHEKINQLIQQLQLLKKSENGEPNDYCEGVAKKLTDKIVSMVRYYGIVASCASDLDPKMKQLQFNQNKLIQLDRNITQLQGINSKQDFEKKYNQQKRSIQNIYRKIKDWNIKQFAHDPQKIAQLLRNSKSQLKELQQQKQKHTQATTGQSANQRRSISNKIVDIIKEIRQLKHSYGVAYHKYDSLANGLWSQTYKYESEMNLKNKLIKLYREERVSYGNMYQQLIDLRAKIYEKLKQSQ